MEEVVRSVVLGIVQGLTEFLPVSSSGHLEIAKFLLGDNSLAQQSMMMTVSLHLATALSTLVIFRKDVMRIVRGIFLPEGREERAFSLKIILSMMPAAAVGMILESEIEMLFDQRLLLVSGMLSITGLLLLLADRASINDQQVGYWDAVVIGIAQTIAILPGISRSGATIATSVMLGIDREKAARFSFLMVVPLIFGKIVVDVFRGNITQQEAQSIPLVIGFLTAFFTGALACLWMIRLVKASQLRYFSIYCWLVAILATIFYLAN